MIENRPLRWIYIKTLLASALVAMIVALRIDLVWGGLFAAGALVGTLNWFLLGVLLANFTQKKYLPALLALQGKIVLLGVLLFAVMPVAAVKIGAFLLGFHMFLLLAVLEALGYFLNWYLRANNVGGSRELPEDAASLFRGKATDA